MFVAGTMVGKLAMWACILKMAFLGLKLHLSFTGSYLDPESSMRYFCPWMATKLLLFIGEVHLADVTYRLLPDSSS